jgi:hypothetical protein
MHLGVYKRRPDVGGIVHTHSPIATTLACLGREIPPGPRPGVRGAVFAAVWTSGGGTPAGCAKKDSAGTP